jgi:hypothetical protein
MHKSQDGGHPPLAGVCRPSGGGLLGARLAWLLSRQRHDTQIAMWCTTIVDGANVAALRQHRPDSITTAPVELVGDHNIWNATWPASSTTNRALTGLFPRFPRQPQETP